MVNFFIDKRPEKNISKDNHLLYGTYLFEHCPASTEGDSSWYAHETIKSRLYLFCSFNTKENLFDLGEFVVRFAKGILFDDEFVAKISRKEISISFCNDLFVFYLLHYTTEKF